MENEKDIRALIVELTNYERKIASLWWNFLRGIVYGLGFFIGSAIVAAIIIYISSMLLRNTPIPGLFNDLVDTYNSIK